MKAIMHPFYEEENRYLTEIIDLINQKLAENREVAAGNQFWKGMTDIEIESEYIAERIRLLEEVLRSQPYFGRIDWKPEHSSEPTVFYIGEEALYGKVYSWADNLAADLYYNFASEREAGTLLLKRQFEINKQQLIGISDAYVDSSLSEVLLAPQFSDTLLGQLLEESRDGQLRKIVATIQRHQFALIRMSKDETVIIQGAPGSGKTAIALHRVAYLLHNYKKDLPAARILILGPNPIFLNYTASVLPSLGQQSVPQAAIDVWLLKILRAKFKIGSQEDSLETMIDPLRSHAEKTLAYRTSQVKSSACMALLLEKYVDMLQEEALPGETLICSYTIRRVARGRVEVTRSPAALRRLVDEHRDLPLNQRLKAVESELVSKISREIARKLEIHRDDREEFLKTVTPKVSKQIHAHFKSWRKWSAAGAYRHLMTDSKRLQTAGSGLFDLWDFELLGQEAHNAKPGLAYSDLGALVYLHILLNGKEPTTVEHLVLDEAQDFSPLQFKVLSSLTGARSMTILGDLGQSIYPYNGILNWETLSEVVSGAQIRIETIQESYRSTWENVQYTNRLLKRFDQSDRLSAAPVDRHGPDPVAQSCSTFTQLVKTLLRTIKKHQADGWRSIALIGKTVAACERLSDAFIQKGYFDFQLMDDREAAYDGAVAIIPTYLSKGLEFDCVIVFDAGADTYGLEELDARLLYVALTRAAHVLEIYWTGSMTPLIDWTKETLKVESAATRFGFKPTTINDFARTHRLGADWCVEQLAAMGKLTQLREGRIDNTLLELWMQHRKKPNPPIQHGDGHQAAKASKAKVNQASTVDYDTIFTLQDLTKRTSSTKMASKQSWNDRARLIRVLLMRLIAQGKVGSETFTVESVLAKVPDSYHALIHELIAALLAKDALVATIGDSNGQYVTINPGRMNEIQVLIGRRLTPFWAQITKD